MKNATSLVIKIWALQLKVNNIIGICDEFEKIHIFQKKTKKKKTKISSLLVCLLMNKW